MKPNPKEVGQRILGIRLSMGMNQKEFARVVNASLPAVSNWETGRNLPNKLRLINIAFQGQISVDELLGKPAQIKVEKEQLRKIIESHFAVDTGDSYVYTLMRQKHPYTFESITMDDFIEFSDEDVDELTKTIWEELGGNKNE